MVGFLFASARLNVVEVSTAQTNTSQMVVYEIMKDASIVVFSTFGVNLLLGLCIERKQRNNAFEDFFSNDFLESNNFNDMVPIDKQEKIYKKYQLEQIFNGKNDVCTMADFLQYKLCSNLLDYYYEKCEYHTYCEEIGGLLKKTFVKSIKVSPLDNSSTIKEFEFFSMYTKKIAGKDHLTITSVCLKNDKNSDTIELKENMDYYVKKSEKIDETLKKKNGYNSHCRCYLSENTVTTMLDKDLSLEIRWYCYEDLNDCLSSTYRVKVPCKDFTLEFTAPVNYEVLPNAFGFIDRSQKATNSEQPNIAKIQFDGWIFPDDGAIINLKKNS